MNEIKIFEASLSILLQSVLVDWPTDGFRQLDGHFLTTVPFISKVYVEGHFTLRVGIDRRLPSIEEGTVDAGLQPGRGMQLLSGRQRLVPFKHLPGSHEEGSMLNKIFFRYPSQCML